MANTAVIPVKAIYTGTDVTALGELAVGDRLDPIYVGTTQYLEVANVSQYTTQYLQVANTQALLDPYMTVANAQSLIGARLGATATVALTGDVTASATAFSANAVSITTDIAATGTPTGTFGSGSLIPIVTVGADGRITNISNTAVAGVSSVAYTTANGNFRITTGDGTTHDATIASGMAVANTRTLINSRLGATATVTLTGDVSGSASFSSNAVSITTQLEDDVSTARLSVNNTIAFTPRNHGTLTGEGKVYYDNIHKTLSLIGEDDIEFELGQSEYIRVYNNSGGTISKGMPVYLSGSTSGVPNAFKANASNASKYNISGLATEDIPNGDHGYVNVSGVVRDFDTSGLTEGERFFVGLTDGALVTTPPTYPNYPMCVGLCVVSNTTNGIVVIEQQNHSVPSFRVINNAYVGGNLTIDGDLTLNGTETTVDTQNLSVANSFVYLNGGDSISNTQFTGSGINDASFRGHYEGTASKTFYVKIDATGTPDTFSWSDDNFATTEATGVAITGSEQALADGISVQFEATTGHTLNDITDGTASPLNVDTGWGSNRNTGASGVGYTHLGVFYDVSANQFKFFDVYDPELAGSINTADASYRAADVSANNFIGNVTGNVTGSAATLATARNIAGQSFDGSGDITIASTDLSDISTLLTSNDAFSDSNTAIMTAAAINDRIEALLPRIYDVSSVQVFP